MGPFSNNPEPTGMTPRQFSNNPNPTGMTPRQFSNNPNPTGIPLTPQPGMPPGPPIYAGGQGNPSWAPQSSETLQPTPEWKVLRILARILKIIAWVEAAIGTLMIIGWTTLMGAALSSVSGSGSSVGNASYYSAGSSMSGIAPYIGGTTAIVALYLLVNTVIAFLLTYGVAEAILVFLAIEKNTRKGG